MRHPSKAVASVFLCVCLAATGQVRAAVPTSPDDATRPAPGREAVARLQADADTPLRVHRDQDGVVDFVGSPTGRGVHNPLVGQDAGPVASAHAHADRYAAMFGIDPAQDDLRLSGTHALASGGSVVRMRQTVSGLPVLGGELAISMDGAGDLTSIVAETTRVDRAGGLSVDEARARRTALAVASNAHGVPMTDLDAGAGERWFYDPTILGVVDRAGPRTVWRFEIGNGYDVRELVLVDARTGRLALHFNQVHELDRVVCDNAGALQVPPEPPALEQRCDAAFARVEGGAVSAVPDVNDAFAFSGATNQLYADVSGIDLTNLIGITIGGVRKLASTVRWCVAGEPCPYPNAFWNGAQMYYGEGFAAGDDVVGHELTHGVIERTSNLLYIHQSGAINESLADIVGEIVDHRFATPGDLAGNWDLGEAIPGGRIRNLQNPPLEGQPDRMTSGLWEADVNLADSGGVHSNSGVGNKTAYLISQGGSFNGQSITGIDSDAGLTRSATLWVDVIGRLVSGSDYADLGRVLVQTCNELAASTASFTPAHCDNVRRAVAATGLSRQPVVANASAPEAPATCPPGTFKRVLFRENVDTTSNAWNEGVLWDRAPFPEVGIGAYATSGKGSFLGLNPDPGNFGDPRSSPLNMGGLVRLPAGQQSFLHFKHAYLFDFAPGFPDGGFVRLRNATAAPYRATTSLPWVNGPRQTLSHGVSGLPTTGFGGVSHGYVSSRLNLSSNAGRQIQFQWVVAGNGIDSLVGWFLDDISVYTCPSVLPTAPRNLVARGGLGEVTVAWQPPAKAGTGITGYRITRSDGLVRRVPASARRSRFAARPGRSYTFTVRALNKAGSAGTTSRATATATTTRLRASDQRVRSGDAVRLSGALVRAGSSRGLIGRVVALQRRAPGTARWVTFSRARTGSGGSYTRALAPFRTFDYRATFGGADGFIGDRSRTVRVRVR